MIDLVKLVEEIYSVIVHNELWVPLGVLVAVAGYLGFWFGRYFPRHPPEHPASSGTDQGIIADYQTKLSECSDRLSKVLDEKNKFSKLTDAIFDEESDLWRIHQPIPFHGYSVPINCSRAKIIVVANNKGGVGKTTLTAALAAYFEKRKRKRVLLVDLDYQGSLSAWMIRAAGLKIPPNQSFRLALANSLIDGTALNQWQPEVLGSTKSRDGVQEAQLITADYTLTQHEMKLMLRWLAEGGTPDVRFNIAQIMQSDRVQHEESGFDVVLIDAPPRLSTSAIEALAAATHLLVPTVLDKLSAETAGSFLKQVWELRSRLNPGLELAGIVGTKTPARPLGKTLGPTEKDALGSVISGLGQWKTNGHVFEMDIQNLAAIRKCAGSTNPYFSDCNVQAMFDSFGDELSERIGL
jgi:cellulose biosynthesis protein BcsQ